MKVIIWFALKHVLRIIQRLWIGNYYGNSKLLSKDKICLGKCLDRAYDYLRNE
jgi:hypothetical protein